MMAGVWTERSDHGRRKDHGSRRARVQVEEEDGGGGKVMSTLSLGVGWLSVMCGDQGSMGWPKVEVW